jgi:hypothetical protein
MQCFNDWLQSVNDRFFEFEGRLMAPVPGAVSSKICRSSFEVLHDWITGLVKSFPEFVYHCINAIISWQATVPVISFVLIRSSW